MFFCSSCSVESLCCYMLEEGTWNMNWCAYLIRYMIFNWIHTGVKCSGVARSSWDWCYSYQQMTLREQVWVLFFVVNSDLHICCKGISPCCWLSNQVHCITRQSGLFPWASSPSQQWSRFAWLSGEGTVCTVLPMVVFGVPSGIGHSGFSH